MTFIPTPPLPKTKRGSSSLFTLFFFASPSKFQPNPFSPRISRYDISIYTLVFYKISTIDCQFPLFIKVSLFGFSPPQLPVAVVWQMRSSCAKNCQAKTARARWTLHDMSKQQPFRGGGNGSFWPQKGPLVGEGGGGMGGFFRLKRLFWKSNNRKRKKGEEKQKKKDLY